MGTFKGQRGTSDSFNDAEGSRRDLWDLHEVVEPTDMWTADPFFTSWYFHQTIRKTDWKYFPMLYTHKENRWIRDFHNKNDDNGHRNVNEVTMKLKQHGEFTGDLDKHWAEESVCDRS